MSNYPPPPPADQPHYNAQYPTTAGAQQLLDSVQQDHFQSQLQQLNQQPIYPKLETSALDPSQYNQLDQRLAEQHHNQHQQQQQQLGLPSPLPPQPQQQTLAQGSPETAPKGNRLRKACDSCSIRKVKDRHAVPVLLWTYLARSKDQADDVVLPTGTQKP
ncbi:hypothetical protein LTR50_000783 [Elasticomyces elasticus]|nr:hypothetical protein LTR50_000783 [Elasticomyces elasticus]